MKATRIAILILSVFLISGCTEWAMDSAEKGWDDFEDGAYLDALAHFDNAVFYDATYPDGYNGLGWSYLMIDSFSLSVENFEYALDYESTMLDAKAGATLAGTEAGEHSSAVSYADDVISSDSDYEFSHLTEVNIDVIRLAKAKSAAAAGDFATALAEIQVFDSFFDADPETNIGQSRILTKLENLMGTYGVWAGN
ncbi:hypothetical protein GF359_09015 [candidate division WOR-3 bacterium]|uniref:Tetratricopeptide repeat protein n=1 Tax=candidate division WOR-3 bacterium TaxID=2052148 RepID=A0A9D5QET7_UNCW3|nr:hypothetical protein [candidate division WOR-3 bacterium]MBD3365340.1 hypothetical protein [candidate division WOR-3 bacterium]